MENILYLDDYINLYNRRKNKIIKIKPYKETLKNGHIINREKFIKIFNKKINEFKISNNIFNNKITVIINMSYTKEDKLLLQLILEELNYKDIKFIQEINYLKIDKKSLYINYNYTYYYIYYLNDFGNMEILMYENNSINRKLFLEVIDLLNKQNIYVYGKNYLEVKNVLESANFNYYYFENSEDFILKIIVNKIM